MTEGKLGEGDSVSLSRGNGGHGRGFGCADGLCWVEQEDFVSFTGRMPRGQLRGFLCRNRGRWPPFMNEKGLPLSAGMSVLVFAHGIVMGRSYTIEWTHEGLGSHDMNIHGCLPM